MSLHVELRPQAEADIAEIYAFVIVKTALWPIGSSSLSNEVANGWRKHRNWAALLNFIPTG